MPITKIDNQIMREGKAGSLTLEIQRAYFDLISKGG